ncbi:MAG: flagellar motor protein MotB [Planctomycetota bacterium]
MAKKKKLEPSVPSKAYLVSFGDTMTALLAFFIVLNSLAKEQTGANMYSGTGSFVSAFSNSGLPGTYSGNRSQDMLQQEAQLPVYALAENLDKNPDQTGNVGPDDTDAKDRVKDRQKQQFQKFLAEIESSFGLADQSPVEGQTVVDAFGPIIDLDGEPSRQTIQLLSDAIAKLRQPGTNLEVIVWANMPSQQALERKLKTSERLRGEVEKAFWLSPVERTRIRYRVKPWLFSDAKRPTVSVVYSKSGRSDAN